MNIHELTSVATKEWTSPYTSSTAPPIENYSHRTRNQDVMSLLVNADNPLTIEL